MAVFWVQQWIALPIILEEPPMGDEPSQHRRMPLGNVSNLTPLQTSTSTTTGDHPNTAFSRSEFSPNDPKFPSPGQQQQMEIERISTGQLPMMGSFVSGHGTRTSPLNMSAMANALPDFQSHPTAFSQQIPQTLPPGQNTPALIYQLQQASQFAGQTPGQNPQFATQYQNYPNVYQPHHGYPHILPSPQQHSGTLGSGQSQQSFMNQHFFPQRPPQQFAPQFAQQPQSIQARANPYQQSYGRRSSGSYGQGPLRQDQDLRGSGEMYGVPDLGSSGAYLQPGPGQAASRQSSGASSTGLSIPRGPPRKPKQSGHALWVGNLPPGTNVIDLKEHFSREATNDIESVFLISKSNCAFVNYRTETSCAAAMARFHDSRFQGVRLVCRLRRGSTAPATGAPASPSSSTQAAAEEPTSPEAEKKTAPEGEAEGVMEAREEEPAPKTRESFFVVKSLTVDDLETSVRNGIWATQAHNEAAFNKAYETSENVYLIFSANKSGEYFGYARMASPISEDSAASLEWVPNLSTAATREPDLPSTIPTPATEVAPRGRIIDDSARGTIFWEADPIESLDKSGDDSKGEESAEDDEEVLGSQSFGKPFKIEWISTDRLPFFRTRGLRNPWNANREVKIARDGTMIEPGVGRRLVQMFHRPLPPGGRPTPPMQIGGFPPQRQF